MNHFDEHIIELFILRSETVEDRRGEIERHLAECHGCRSLAREIERFYADVETALQEGKTTAPVPETALARAPRALEPYYEPYTPVETYRPSTVAGRVRHFVRRYPIASGVGSFALAAALVGLALLRPGQTATPKDTNPAYSRINSATGSIEIFNNRDERVRQIPTTLFLNADQPSIVHWSPMIQVTDLDGDGTREVVTGFSVGAQPASRMPLTIHGSDAIPPKVIYFSSPLKWREDTYADDQSVQSFAISGLEGSAGREIFVIANYGRSPNTLYRLSKDGAILGEYNHFGGGFVTVVRFPGSKKDHVVFYGQNDSEEPESLSYAVMIVLDPLKITGKTEAGDSRGFGLPASPAEEYIIRFPLSDMNKPLLSQAFVGSITLISERNQPRISVDVRGGYSQAEFGLALGPAFSYITDADFNILAVKYDTPTIKLRNRMIGEGRLKDLPVEKYLARLKDAVLYWNGTGWQKEATRVVVPSVPAPAVAKK